MDGTERHAVVRERYARAATVGDGCCGPCGTPSAVGGGATTAEEISCAVGYDESELSRVPEGANLGLGCGNPVEGGYGNVELRLSEIEALPVRDGVVDVVISNCVLNLSADRPRVLAEVMRVLKPGGRMMISDLVSDRAVPDFIAASRESLVGCLPVQVAEYEADLAAAGFTDISVKPRQRYPAEHVLADPRVQAVVQREPWRKGEVGDFVRSIHGGAIGAVKGG